MPDAQAQRVAASQRAAEVRELRAFNIELVRDGADVLGFRAALEPIDAEEFAAYKRWLLTRPASFSRAVDLETYADWREDPECWDFISEREGRPQSASAAPPSPTSSECPECGMIECECPNTMDLDVDPWAAGSHDCFYDGIHDVEPRARQLPVGEAAHHARLAPHVLHSADSRQVIEAFDPEGEFPVYCFPEDCGLALARRYGDRASFYAWFEADVHGSGTAATTSESAVPSITASPHVAKPPLGSPPMRSQFPKGRGAVGDAGREAFRQARAAWYLEATGVPLEGSVAEQNERYDIIARRFRAYTSKNVPPPAQNEKAVAAV
jgi:hypothetical protein